MLRTHKARPFGGASVPLMVVVMALVTGLLAASAQADDAGTPAEPAQSGAAQPSTGATSLLAVLGGPPAVQNDSLVLKRGLTDSLSLGANDDCHGQGCVYTAATPPAGWGAGIAPGTDTMTIWVPKSTVPGMYQVGYTAQENGGSAVQAVVNVAVTPDDYNPPAGMIFSHPYRKGYRYTIRDHVLRTINSTPPGASIQVASWSFASRTYRTALQAARARGVKVQIVLAQRNKPKNSDFGRLLRNFGSNVTADGSWVKKCWYSCRGVSGTMHSKIFLFSQAYRTPYVMISGSANLTDFAVTNQWNQMNTVTGEQGIYQEAVNVFTQMYQDTPAPYIETHFPTLTSYYYPRGKATPANDFMMQALAPVRCTGAVNAAKGGRTIVKIAMYAWYQDRGKWLAKRVRQLWQQGCQVQIVYAISSNPVKTILYSPAGRGRIPMRQILLTNKNHVPIYYLHDKWVSITGNYAGVPNNSVSFQGSFNFSDLGFISDEQFQMIPGRAAYNRFARDFTLLWKDRQARAPSPVSKIPTIEGRYTQNDLRLGTGVYRYMDAD
ncbi:phospholipase D-like domain-containing protein [Marmoricola sp. URHA0025 HA25]